MSEDILHTIKETAKILKTNPDFVYDLVNHGLLQALKLGRLKVRHAAIDEFLKTWEGHDLSDLNNIVKLSTKK